MELLEQVGLSALPVGQPAVGKVLNRGLDWVISELPSNPRDFVVVAMLSLRRYGDMALRDTVSGDGIGLGDLRCVFQP